MGTPVPVGVYNRPADVFDPATDTWQAQPDGRVIKILSVSGGVATVDANGDGLADTPAQLTALEFTSTELAKLALAYPAGTSLMRMRLLGFYPYDANFPSRLLGADPVVTPTPGCASAQRDVIKCDVRNASQAVTIPGTPLSLAYSSARAEGAADRTIRVPLLGATVPANLYGVRVRITVAGQFTEVALTPTPNLAYTYTWDGLDAYGRPVQGSPTALVEVGFRFPIEYQVPAAVAASFGLPCTGTASGGAQACVLEQANTASPGATERHSWWRVTTASVKMGSYDAKAQGLGGFDFNVHHMYDPVGRVLYLGDGTNRVADAITPVIKTVAGRGLCGLLTDNVQATTSCLVYPAGAFSVLAMADGGFLETDQWEVRRVRPDGVIQRFAGLGQSPTTFQTGNDRSHNPDGTIVGEGGPATGTYLYGPSALALGGDGTVYISDGGRIVRVAPTGILTRVMGRDVGPQAVDGMLARVATLDEVQTMAVGLDGALYFATQNDANRIFRLGADSVLHVIAGTGFEGVLGDGGPARQSRVGAVTSLAVGPDGSLYLGQDDIYTASFRRVRRITPDGLITTVAGGEVGHPQLIRLRRRAVAVDQVMHRVRCGIGDRRAHTHDTAQALRAHEARDGAARGHDALPRELTPHLPHAVDAPVGVPDARDRRAERAVPLRSRGSPRGVRRTRLGLVVGRWSNRQLRADWLDSIVLAMRVDERHHHVPRRSSSAWAKYAAAFRRISFACRNSRTSRSNLQPLLLLRRDPRALPGITLRLADPEPEGFCRTADLAGNRRDRPPLRRVLSLVVSHQPYCPLPHFRRKPRTRHAWLSTQLWISRAYLGAPHAPPPIVRQPDPTEGRKCQGISALSATECIRGERPDTARVHATRSRRGKTAGPCPLISREERNCPPHARSRSDANANRRMRQLLTGRHMPSSMATARRRNTCTSVAFILALASAACSGGDGGVGPTGGGGGGGETGGGSLTGGGGTSAAAGLTVYWTRNAQLLPLTLFQDRTQLGAVTTTSSAAPTCAGAATLTAPASGSSLVEASNSAMGSWLMELPAHSGCTTVEIVYTPATLTIAAAGSGSGVVQSISRVIDCSISAGRVSTTGCSNTRNSGSLFSLRATSAPGSQFLGWVGGCAGVGEGEDCSYKLTGSSTLTAQFQPAATAPATGRLSIWTDYTSAIAVQVGGAAAGSLTQYFASGTPTCGQSGTLTLTLPVGTHSVTGASGSATWNTSGVVVSGGCTLVKLSAPSGGGGTASTGRLSIWTDYASAIAVGVDGASVGSLTQYFASGTPTCGQSGTLTVTLAVGTHSVSGSAGSSTWNTTGSVTAGGCTLLKLSAPSGGGGTGGGGGTTSSTGARVSLCVSNLQSFANSQWRALPAPLGGLDAKVYYSTTWSTADVVFRNRYVTPIHFNEVVYRSGVSPAPRTTNRHDLNAGREEGGPGANLGVNVGLGGTACVVVDMVRFNADTGPYFNP